MGSDLLLVLAPAWAIGAVLCLFTAPLGCLMLWRRMSFFCDTMAHGALLCVALAALLHLPWWLGILALGIGITILLWFLHDQRLANDALLAFASSTLLCAGLVLIQLTPNLRADLISYLFGDLISLQWSDFPIIALCVGAACLTLIAAWKKQIQLSIDEAMAIGEGINGTLQRFILMGLFALFTVLALKAVGSLLMTALLIIPALTARLLAKSPKQMVIWAFVWAQFGLVMGLSSSIWLDTPSGVTIVLCMAFCFIFIYSIQKIINYRSSHSIAP